MSPEGVTALWVTDAKLYVSTGEMGKNLVRILPTRVSGGKKGKLQNTTEYYIKQAIIIIPPPLI
jgi:hypothetical protein